MSNTEDTGTNVLVQGLIMVALIAFAVEFVGCASTKIAPDGKGNYQAIMESSTFAGIGTDYAERVNGSMQVNESTKMELDEAIRKYGGGSVE